MNHKRLLIVPAVTVLAFVAILLTVLYADHILKREQLNEQELRTIVGHVSQCNRLQTEYLMYPEERIITQWNLAHAAVGRLNDTVEVPNADALAQFYERNQDVATLFSQIVELAGEEPANLELRNRLLSQLLVRQDQELLILESMQLENERHTAQAVKTAVVIIFTIVVLALAAILLATLLVFRSVEKQESDVEKAKAQFFSMTSHELRSPITPMRGQLEMLLADQFGKIKGKQREALEIVHTNTMHLDMLIADLLDVSRLNATTVKLRIVKVSLEPELKRLVSEMDTFLPEKRVRLDASFANMPEVETDPFRAVQVLRNLLTNAKKFCTAQSVVTLNAVADAQFVTFSVRSDTVIPAADHAKIFHAFYQGDEIRSRMYNGTGLGLVVCKGMVELLGGKIWFESSPDAGTTFSFTLPLPKKA